MTPTTTYLSAVLGTLAAITLYFLVVGGKAAYSRTSTFVKGLTCLAFSFTAPIVMLVGMWTVSKTSKNLPSILRWYDTPDEPELVDLDLQTTKKIWDFWWRLAVYDWFGFRNRAHGFTQMFAREAPTGSEWKRFEYGFDTNVSYRSETGAWLNIRQVGPLRFFFGWQTYTSVKFGSGLEYRPMLSVKYRAD